MNINIASIWSALVATGMAMLWLFTNIAWAADIERLEARMIKQQLREVRSELRHEDDEQTKREILEEIEELIDDLCEVKPDDRECN